jgi:hypothetical protein
MHQQKSPLEKRMKKLILFILIIITPLCTTTRKEKTKTKKPHKDIIVHNLKDFFLRCEQDVLRAKKVIIEEDIVKNLSHLLRMNNGGKKYYILERENTTKMIRSVTKGVYTDFILINRKGVVIYTAVNNDIFGKNVRSHLRGTPLLHCYNNIKEGIYFHDISTLSPEIERHSLFVAVKVKGGISFPGLFVLQVSTRKLVSYMEKGSFALSKDGIYRISRDPDKIQSSYEDFGSMDLSRSMSEGTVNTFRNRAGVKFLYRPFTHRNINWMIVSESLNGNG